MIASLALRVRSLTGWRRNGWAMVLGALAAAALPPVHALPLLVVAFSGLVWVIDGSRTARSAAMVGWSFGAGHFAAGLYWIANAFMVDPERFGWMAPFAIAGLSAGLGVFPALAAAVARTASRPGAGRVLVLAAAWTAVEMLRGWVLTGFPWNLIATAWTAVPPMMQLAALTGPFGVGLLTVAAAAAPSALTERRGGFAVAAAVLVLAVVWIGGAVRLDAAGPVSALPTAPGVRLRLVQANIPQTLKWLPELREYHFLKHIEMSREVGFEAVTHILWPETAAPYSLDLDEGGREMIARAIPPGGAVITGAPRWTPQGREPRQAWNSVFVIGSGGKTLAFYDKAHLVPFGEYVPFHDLLPLRKLTVGSMDFSAGDGRKTLTAPGLPPFSPLICYEVIFPGEVAAPDPRPSWLFNPTNDAWYGNSAGPYQHFASTRWRAVEEGLPLVRTAITGISGVVDPFGRVVTRIGLGKQGVLDSPLPLPLPAPPPYVRWRDIPVTVAIIILLGGGFLTARRLNPGGDNS